MADCQFEIGQRPSAALVFLVFGSRLLNARQSAEFQARRRVERNRKTIRQAVGKKRKCVGSLRCQDRPSAQEQNQPSSVCFLVNVLHEVTPCLLTPKALQKLELIPCIRC
jgi:hypothetical protein